MAVRDFDPDLAMLDVKFSTAVRSLRRRPMADGQPWRVSDEIWQVAALFKEQMEATYKLLDASGVLAMDPDGAPAGVPIRMEYSTFCQGCRARRSSCANRVAASSTSPGARRRVRVAARRCRSPSA